MAVTAVNKCVAFACAFEVVECIKCYLALFVEKDW